MALGGAVVVVVVIRVSLRVWVKRIVEVVVVVRIGGGGAIEFGEIGIVTVERREPG